MQRYGPPPSYPNLKIPGLNAPIPQGCSFGYHAGGWGKPPVDETGKPLYGDVFGTTAETKTVSVFLELFLFFTWLQILPSIFFQSQILRPHSSKNFSLHMSQNLSKRKRSCPWSFHTSLFLTFGKDKDCFYVWRASLEETRCYISFEI